MMQSSGKPKRGRQATPVAIIGMGCMFPKAGNLEAYWANIREGVDAITPVPDSHWNLKDYLDSDPKRPDKTYAARGGFISPVDFDPLEFGISPKDIEATDTTQLLGMVAARQALIDAGYGLDREFDRQRTSIILGVTGTLELVIPLGARLGHPIWRQALKDAGVSSDVSEDVVQRISDSYVEWQENSFPGLLGNVAAGRIANRLDLGGTNCVVDAACASSLGAIHLAQMELEAGRSDMVITGGVDTFNDIFMYMCFSKTPALSPSGDARPFSSNADGTMLGEGLGLVVMKRLEDAERDNDRIYAVIRGMGTSSDGKGNAVYAPSSEGQVRALKDAYAIANVTPDTIELVEAHGTGTKVGDAAEFRALVEVYQESGRKGSWCNLGSIKSQIGHTKAASGVAGLIKAVMALHRKVLPPTIKIDRPLADAETSPFYLNNLPRPWLGSKKHPRRAAVSAFGFGGSNFHCVLEESPVKSSQVDWDGKVQILVCSSDRKEDLLSFNNELSGLADWESVRRFGARSREQFNVGQAYRLIYALKQDTVDWKSLCKKVSQQLKEKGDAENWSLENNVFFGQGKAEGEVVFLFPGQGSQSVGMFRELVCAFPVMQDVLSDAETTFSSKESQTVFLKEADKSLVDFVFPKTDYSQGAEQRQTSDLKNTEVAQPAIGSVSLGIARVLESFGLKPGKVAGHSYGELSALCVSGRIKDSDFHQLSNLRGRLMAAAGQEAASPGGMLAVKASPNQLDSILAEFEGRFVIANENSPEQTVIAGPLDEMDQLCTRLSSVSIWNKQLNVATAFHSPLIDPAKEPFRKALKSVRFSAGKLPVYANVTGSSYPKAGTEAKKLLTDQLTSPVRFVDLIKSIHQDGGTYFIETGPGNVLTGLVQSTLKGQSYRARAVDGGKGSKSAMHSLARVLAETASIGYSVNLKVWDQDFAEQVSTEAETIGSGKPRLMIPVCGANKKPSKERRPPKAAAVAQVSTVSNKPIQPEKVSNRSKALDSNTEPVAKSGLRKEMVNHVGSNGKTEKTVRNTSTQEGSEYATSYQVSRDPLIALQKLQQQTADLHRQFLENQQTAMESFQMLMQPQQGSVIPSAVPAENRPIDRDTGNQLTPVAQTQPDPEPVKHWKPSIERTEEKVEKTVQPEVAEIRNGNTELADVLLKVVADKTGYPEDMLTLEMGLDSDLGIDSIKRVEIMSALQSAYPAAPEIKPEDLGRFETLEQIVTFLSEQIPEEKESVTEDSQAVNVSTSLISETLLQVVSDKTGYPEEMLQLDMGLDADLGIDSIKRVEIMSALQTALPDAPEITPEELGRLNTLQEVVDYLSSGNDHQEVNSVSPSFIEAEEVLLKIVSEKTGYPLEMLNVDMGLDSDLGIDSIKRVEIMSTLQIEMPEAPEIKAEHLGQFQTIREIVDFITESLPQKKEPSSDTQTSEPEPDVSGKETAPVLNLNNSEEEMILDRQVIRTVALNGEGLDSVHQVAPDSDVWLCDDGSDLALQIESEFKSHGYRIHRKTLKQIQASSLPKRLSGLILMTPIDESIDSFLEDSFSILKKAAPGLRKEGKRHGSILVSISRLDGHFGFGNLIGKGNPVSGGLAGLVKTANHEWPEVQCRSIDLDPEYEDIKELGRAVFQEIFRKGPVEIGISKDQTCTLELHSEPLQGSPQEKPIRKGEVIVVSGGGRGVTAASAMALAKAFKPTLVLLGRSPEPEMEPDWLSSLEDEKEIKKAIVTQMNGGSSLKEVERQYRHWMSNRELNRNFAKMEELGATVIYRSLDIRDEKAVATVLNEIREKYGPLKGLIHGAGVLADRRIEDKTKDQFQQVYSTKVDGFKALVSAIGDDPIKIMGLFSSFTGRYGRAGQVAYAAANEVLNKLAQSEARKRPDCRVVAFNWGPWNGGMVTPSLKALFEKEGVGLIDLGAGAQFMVDELSADRDQPVEIVVMASSRNRNDHRGKPQTGPSTDDWGKLSLETKVDIESVPCLESHIMKGKAVLPMSIMAEWMIQGALHDYPGMVFNGFRDLKVFKGILVDADESTILQIRLGEYPQNGERTSVPVKLISTDSSGRKVIHAEAQVELSHTVVKAVKPLSALDLDVDERKMDELYAGNQLFHGTHFQGILQIIRSGAQGLHAAVMTDASPKNWMKNPLRSTWVGDPLLWDCCFQLMILWCRKFRNLPSLPTGVGGYQQFVKRIPAGIKEVIIQITAITNREIQAKMDLLSEQGKLLARIENYRCVMDASLDQAFQNNCLNPS